MTEKNLHQKLLEAQKEIGAIKKDSDNPFFKSKYADINAILREVKPVLNKHGLVLMQALNVTESRTALLTSIVDADSGLKVESNVFLPDLTKPQDMGSAVTYFRRYALQSLLALEAEDDDGNTASAVGKKPAAPVTKVEKKFLADLEPTDEEIILHQEKLESAKDLKDLKAIWSMIPPMVQDKLEKLKDELKFRLA